MSDSPLFVEERKIKIVEFIEHHKKATVAQLCDHFGVSSATIRNDLRDLERDALVLRTHGGAMIRTKTRRELISSQREVQHLEEKRRIARKALELVEDGDTIILDTGTTTLELARLLGGKRDLTVVTNDLAIGLALERFTGVEVVFMGGIVRRNFHCTVSVGERGATTLAGLVVDKAFMGVNSLSAKNGASTPDLATADTKRRMIAIATRVIILCDHSKFEQSSFAQFASIDDIDVVVTDACRDTDRELLLEHEIDLLIADE